MTVGRSGCGVKMILTGLPKFLPTFVLEYSCMILYKKLFCYFLSMNEESRTSARSQGDFVRMYPASQLPCSYTTKSMYSTHDTIVY